jgi:hypothetical protein
MNLKQIEEAVAKAIDPNDHDRFFEWATDYGFRLASVTGIALTTLSGEGCSEVTEEYWDDLWKKYLSGAGAEATADEDAKSWKNAFD